MTRFIAIVFTLLIINTAYSQQNLGRVKIYGKPENAIIKLADSLLNPGQIYTWPQGIYKLHISAEGYQNFQNSYFQVYKNRLNSYDFKLKNYKEKKDKSEVSLRIPKILVPAALSGAAAIGFNYLLFPIADQSNRLNQIENYNSQLDKIASSNYPNWNMTEEEQRNYQEIKSKYLSEIENYNNQAKKNNDNKNNRIVFPATVLNTAAVVFFILEYRVYKKKKKVFDLGFQPHQTRITYSF